MFIEDYGLNFKALLGDELILESNSMEDFLNLLGEIKANDLLPDYHGSFGKYSAQQQALFLFKILDNSEILMSGCIGARSEFYPIEKHTLDLSLIYKSNILMALANRESVYFTGSVKETKLLFRSCLNQAQEILKEIKSEKD